MHRLGRTLWTLWLIVALLPWGGMAATPVAASANPKILINEIYRGGTLGSTGNEWIELVLIQDLTAAQLEGFYVGDSTSTTAAKFSGYKFTNMGSIAANFPKGTIIVVGGGAAFTEDTAYDPANGDWNLLLFTTGEYFTGNTYLGDLAATDVAYVDTNGTYGNATMSADGFAIHWGTTTGAFGALADVKVTAPANPGAMALNSDLAGALTPANWSAPTSPTPGQPNGSVNTSYIEGLRAGGPAATLGITKNGPAQVLLSETYTYTLAAVNQTGAVRTNVVITDSLPLSVTVGTISDGGVAVGNVVSWTVATLADGATVTRTVQVTAPDAPTTLINSDYGVWASDWITRATNAAVQTVVLIPGGVTPIAVARAAGTGWNGSLQGKVTVPPGIYRGNAFVIQDATGGLYIYTGNFSLPAITLGDTVRVTGTLTVFGGQLQMDPMTGIANLGSGTPPDPRSLTTGAVAANEGWLARVTGTATWTGTPPAPGVSNFTINANDGSGSVQVFIDLDTRIDMRGYTSGMQLTIIGFVGNYNGTRQVMPRYQSDVWDMLPPQVTATYPTANAADVYPYFPITATFSKALDATTVTTETFTLADALGPVEGVVSYDAGTRTATFDPTAALAAQTRYTATLTTGIKETHDIAMAANYVWSFTTGDADLTPPTITGRYPTPDATNMPLSVNVVVTFSEAIDPATLSGNFTLTGPYGAVPVAVTYNPAAFTVVLNPTSNLLPTSRYTATVAAGVADWSGLTLDAASTWSFETAVEPPMSAYHGDIHNHTSYSDGSGTPTQALDAGRAAGFDFMAISDHSYAIDDTEWANTLAAVNAATIEGAFVALRGFEYTQGAEGHANVYNTVRHAVRTNVAGCAFCDYTPNLEAGVTVQGFYPWLAITGTHALDGAGTVMQFNHPGWINFNDWTFHPEVGDTARLSEVGNGNGTSYAFSEDEYIRALDYGWKVGATNNADTHSTYWGTNTPHRTGLWAPGLTKSDLLDALRERRTFAAEDTDYELYLKGNGAWMGTEIPNTGQIAFEIYAADPGSEAAGVLELVTNGGLVVTSTTAASASFTWQFILPVTPGAHYYYVRATQADGDRIVSSPVWTQGIEDIAITDLTVQPSLSTIYNPSLLTARITNRGATTQTVTVTFTVDGVAVGSIPLTVGTCTRGPCSDGYANLSWQPTATGPATVAAQFTAVPADSPDDNTRSLTLNVTDEQVPLVLIDAGHGNIGTSNPREARHFVDDLTAHGYNVLFNLDAITASDLNTTTVKLLIINAYGPSQLTAAEITAIAEYIAAGGNLWLNGIADYTGKVAWANTAADRQNALVAAIETATGAQIPIRMNDDEVLDGNNNNGYPWGVLWHIYPAAQTTGVGINVKQIQSWSDCSLMDRNKSALTQADLGANGFIIIEGDLDAGTGTYGYPNRTHSMDADRQGDAYIYPTTTPLAGAAGYDIPGVAGRMFFYGDSNDPFNIFAYTAGDGKQNELFNLQTVMWLLGEPLQKSTIAQARADAELNNTPDNLHKLVWVEGKITAAYGEFFNVLYVQDETGGITVHAPAGDISATQFMRGTTVRVVGTIGAYNGDTEIEFFEAEMVQVLTPSTDEVAPRPFTTGAAALEVNEGWLTQITGTVTSKVGDEAIFVDDGSGPIRAFLDGYNGDFSDIAANDIVTVKGLISEDGEGRRIRVRNYKTHYPTIANDVTKLGALALTLDKSATPTVGNSPAPFTYTLTLANGGPVTALNVVITDALPSGLTFGGFVAANGALYADGVITWTGSVPSTASVTVIFTATATATGQTTQTITNTAHFAGPGVAGSASAAVQVVPPPLPIIVTEFLPDPLAVADTVGEWLEVYNPNSVPVDLKGWKLSDLGTDKHIITRTVIVPAGGYVVLGRNADPLVNGGVAVAYQYSNFQLTNTGDAIILTDALGREVDRVAYTFGANGWPTAAQVVGRALQMCNPFTDNNVGSAWSLAAYRWTPPTSDYGSPGLPNDCAALTIGKSVVPQTTVQLGSLITYTVHVTNTGGDAANVRVVDVLPVGVSGANLEWTGLIAANTTAVFTLPGVVTTSAAFYGQTLVNTAVYTYLTHSDIASATLTLATAPQLTLTKTVTPESGVFPGDQVTYTLTLCNSGETPASGIVLTDTLPWEMNFATWVTQGGATVSDDTIIWNGNLPGGASVIISFRAAVRTDSFFTAHPVVNTATYTADDLSGGLASATFDLGGVVALALTKTVTTPDPAFPGDAVTYTLVLNNAQGVAGGVVLTDILPAEVDFGGWVTQNGASVTNDVITWGGDLGANASQTIIFRAILHTDSALYGQTITNTATFAAANTLPGSATAAFTVAPQPEEPLLRLTKTVQTNGDPLPGDNITYTLALANLGGGDATGVALTDTLPVALGFGGWIAQNGASVSDDVITWSGDLAANAGQTIVFTATLHTDPALYGETITNTAQATAINAEGATAEIAVTVGVPAEEPVLRLTKTVQTDGDPLPGDSVTYTLTLANIGGGDATGVHLTDTLPAALDFGGWIAQNGASMTDGVITWSGDLAASARQVIVFTATLHTDPALYGETITNTAQATADNADGATAEIAFTVGDGGTADVTITKDVAAAAAVVDAGGVVTYTIALNNSGDVPATGVLLTDTLPVEVDFGGWITQNGAAVAADVLTWSGDLAVGEQATCVFTATVRSDVALDGRTVVNTARFTWGATGAEDTAGFTLRRIWKIFLPLTMRNS